jgi:hypothetical protein
MKEAYNSLYFTMRILIIKILACVRFLHIERRSGFFYWRGQINALDRVKNKPYM